MKTPGAPLSEDELDMLDRFLIDRIDENEETTGKDEGILDISELDGLLTAIVSGPETIPPSQWLPAVWGDYEPVWESEQDFERILTLIMRHMNGIADTLMEQPQDFEPLFLERRVKGKTYTIVDEWCQGYMRGVNLAIDAWNMGGPEATELLMPVLMFVSEKGWEMLDQMSSGEVESLQQSVIVNVRKMHAFWLARREENSPADSLARQTEPYADRDDPCPCGSGKKYKKCCLH